MNSITAAFTSDAAGNVSWDTTNALSYDAEGRMNPMTGTKYTQEKIAEVPINERAAKQFFCISHIRNA